MKISPDFTGWATKHDVLCDDGLVIKHGAFAHQHGQQIPLVWEHQHNKPENVLGYAIIEHTQPGVKAHAFFNDTDSAKVAKNLVKHGDIKSLSMFAKCKKDGNDVIKGDMYEVSLVMHGCNPGATIEIVGHSSDGVEEMLLYPGVEPDFIMHSGLTEIEIKEEIKMEDSSSTVVAHTGRTGADIVASMTDEQRDFLAYVALQLSGNVDDVAQSILTQLEGEGMEKTIFELAQKDSTSTIAHSAHNNNVKAVVERVEELIAHSAKNNLKLTDVINNDEVLVKHGIHNIEGLFPEPTEKGGLKIYQDRHLAVDNIMSKVGRTPFATVRTTVFDISMEEARAKGYIKGNMKKEQAFNYLRRSIKPGTVYAKDKIHRDDELDCTEYGAISLMKQIMKIKLKEEIVRAILVGDGREVDDEDKISESLIIPITKDSDIFTIKQTTATYLTSVEDMLKAQIQRQGSSEADVYMSPASATELLLIKEETGSNKRLYSSLADVASAMGVRSIVKTSLLPNNTMICVNLQDYNIGTVPGGQTTMFDHFDIDYNLKKFLAETRVSGMLTYPKSAVVLTVTSASTIKNFAGTIAPIPAPEPETP